MAHRKSKLEIVKDAYASFGRGDVDGFFAAFDDNFSLIEADGLPYGGTFRGVENAKSALFKIAGYWTDLSYDIAEYAIGENVIIAYGRLAATAKTTGKKIAMPLAEVWQFDGDTVLSITPLYFDTAAAAAALS